MKQKYLDFRQEYLNKGLEVSDIDFAFCNIFNKKRYELANLILSEKDIIKIKPILLKLLNKQPLSDIFKTVNFYGREFFINRWVLTPRFETEELVFFVLNLIKKEELTTVLDLCSGSGCIGLTLKLELNKLDVTLSDISEYALLISKENSRILNSKVKFVRSDLLENLKDEFDLIVSNPPYIRNKDIDILEEQVLNYDPHISLFGGEDGLDYYRKIENQTKNFKNLKYIVFEFGINQKEELKKIFKNYKIKFIKDLNGIDRILVIKR